ncbi:MAG: AAA family ATPase [Lachnospiraceae bacterium]|nr:AAA family ATPase [Lachnospiraceae bacterium]
MSLTNSQYDAILREYDAIQLKNERLLSERKAEIADRLPAYEELTSAAASLSVSYGKKMLLNGQGNMAEYHEKMQEISRKKRELLLANGYPEDFLSPIYDCPDCKDTGFVNGEKCHCLQSRIINILYSKSNLQKVLQAENFSVLSYDYYKGEDLQNFKKAVENSLSFVRNFDTEYQNLLFFGAVGTGKTFLSNCIAYELLQHGYSVIYFSASGLFEMLSKQSFSSSEKEVLYKTQEDLYNCDLVIIDDLGTELTNAFTNTHLFSILNERSLRKKPVIISTNLSLEGLKERYSERIFSRVTNTFTFRKLSGSDIRMRKKFTNS